MESYYSNQDIEAILNMVYSKPANKKKQRLLDILPKNVIQNTIKRHPKDKFTWVSDGLLHTRARESYSNPLA